MMNGGGTESRKKPRKDEEEEGQSPVAEKEEGKAKPTRGSRSVILVAIFAI